MADSKRPAPPAKGARRKPRAKAKDGDANAFDEVPTENFEIPLSTPGETLSTEILPPAALSTVETEMPVPAEMGAPLSAATEARPAPMDAARPPSGHSGPPRRDRDRDRGDRDQDRGDRDRDLDRDRDRDRDRPPSDRGPEQGARQRSGDEYLFQTYYDRSARAFVAFALEYPEVKVTAASRDAAVKELESRLETHLANLKRKGEAVTEPYLARRYPDKLEVGISQNLFRKLDLMSRHEKIGLDQLVTEILTSGLEKKTEAPRPRPQERRSQGQGQQQERGGQRHGGNQHRHGNQNPRGRNYQDTMNNRENFMEYVRNLEKGNYRKK